MHADLDYVIPSLRLDRCHKGQISNPTVDQLQARVSDHLHRQRRLSEDHPRLAKVAPAHSSLTTSTKDYRSRRHTRAISLTAATTTPNHSLPSHRACLSQLERSEDWIKISSRPAKSATHRCHTLLRSPRHRLPYCHLASMPAMVCLTIRATAVEGPNHRAMTKRPQVTLQDSTRHSQLVPVLVFQE